MYYVEGADIQDYYMSGWGNVNLGTIHEHNGGYSGKGTFAAVHNINEWHQFEINIWNNSFDVYYDSVFKQTFSDATHDGGHVGFRCDKPAAGAYYYDNIIVRFYMEPVPTLAFGAETIAVVNPPAVLSNESPVDESLQIVHNPYLIITIGDDNTNMDITFMSNSSGSWISLGTNNSVGNGTYQQTGQNMATNNTMYWWSVNVSDNGSIWINETYVFTTGQQNGTGGGGTTTIYTDTDVIRSQFQWHMILPISLLFSLLYIMVYNIINRKKRKRRW